MPKQWRPRYGDHIIPEEVKPAKVVSKAILNFPPEGTRISAELLDWKVDGTISHVSVAYGNSIWVEKAVWVDGHSKGRMKIHLDLDQPWVITLLEEE